MTVDLATRTRLARMLDRLADDIETLIDSLHVNEYGQRDADRNNDRDLPDALYYIDLARADLAEAIADLAAQRDASMSRHPAGKRAGLTVGVIVPAEPEHGKAKGSER